MQSHATHRPAPSPRRHHPRRRSPVPPLHHRRRRLSAWHGLRPRRRDRSGRNRPGQRSSSPTPALRRECGSPHRSRDSCRSVVWLHRTELDGRLPRTRTSVRCHRRDRSGVGRAGTACEGIDLRVDPRAGDRRTGRHRLTPYAPVVLAAAGIWPHDTCAIEFELRHSCASHRRFAVPGSKTVLASSIGTSNIAPARQPNSTSFSAGAQRPSRSRGRSRRSPPRWWSPRW